MERYKCMGLKLTPQRLAILGCLEGNKTHPSAEEIYNEVAKKFPTMSLATVYNTLEVLRRKGEVQELTIDPDKKRFDPDTGPHHHLICTGCKRIVDVRVDYSPTLPAGEDKDFEILGSHIEFYGLCPECRKGDRYRAAVRLSESPEPCGTGRKSNERKARS